jgi:hypothetical protein
MEDKNYPMIAKYRLKERDADGEFGPLLVSNKSHPALQKVIEAFENSAEIPLGYTTIEKNKGVVEPTMKKKTLYLCGASVRDHLANQPFHHYDLVTDASPDEIKKILKGPATRFKEVKPISHDLHMLDKYEDLPSSHSAKNYFYASRWDKAGTEIEVTAVVNGQKLYISPFCIHEKYRGLVPLKAKFTTSIEQDAATRDITINAMYIKLKDPDGENGELIDPQGGMHDLKAGIVQLIRRPELAFERNPYLPFNLCGISARFAKNGNLSKDLTDEIRDFENSDYDPKILKRMFVATIENPEVPVAKYVDNLKKAGLLNKIFPKLHFSNICDKIDCTQIPNNKIIGTAMLMLGNDPFEVEKILKTRGFSDLDAENVQFLLRLGRIVQSGNKNPHVLSDLFSKPVNIGKSIIKQFLNLLGSPNAYERLINKEVI